MASLTLFTAPKPFSDPHIATIQRNAIRSWALLPDTQVFLIGEESGIAEAARELGVGHLDGVLRNAEGTPLVSSIFDLARSASQSPLLAYVNADIILMPDLPEAANIVAGLEQEFILVGQRWDVDIREPLDFSGDWATRLHDLAHATGRLHKPMGSDYFVFPRKCFTDLPPFAVGRAGWDNWMIFKAREERWKTIDATHSITIIHQNHDYAHLPGGQKHHRLPESAENKTIAGGRHVTGFTLKDATHDLRDYRLRRKPWNIARFLRWFETAPLLYFGSSRMTALLSRTLNLNRKKRRRKKAK